MPVLAIDLGGTKLATAVFDDAGSIIAKRSVHLERRAGAEVGVLIAEEVAAHLSAIRSPVSAIGVSVPGISRVKTGTVWAPNIPGWEDYPLQQELRQISGGIPVTIDNDRACGLMGELWKGNAQGCRDVIFLAVGTGIGAGILVDGNILRGTKDIAGSIGWMALDKPFQQKYVQCGCFEYYASGDGIAKLAAEMLETDSNYKGVLTAASRDSLTAHHVFEAFESGDPLAHRVFAECIQYWGMAVANLVSIFNPEKIIFGGGVFGPALQFLKPIAEEARKWAQPISMNQVVFEGCGLEGDAAIYGAGSLALNNHQ